MSEKFEKCPNCDEKLSGMFSKDIVKDEVIKEINEKIKKTNLRILGKIQKKKRHSALDVLVMLKKYWKEQLLVKNPIQNALPAEQQEWILLENFRTLVPKEGVVIPGLKLLHVSNVAMFMELWEVNKVF